MWLKATIITDASASDPELEAQGFEPAFDLTSEDPEPAKQRLQFYLETQVLGFREPGKPEHPGESVTVEVIDAPVGAVNRGDLANAA